MDCFRNIICCYSTQITPIQSGLAILGFITSYIIFRWSNWQKGTFRNNPLTQSLSREYYFLLVQWR